MNTTAVSVTLYHTGFQLRKLSYEVIANSERPSSGALASLTLRESTND